jgi:hypothetical protein
MNLALLYKKPLKCRYLINKDEDGPYHKEYIVSRWLSFILQGVPLMTPSSWEGRKN